MKRKGRPILGAIAGFLFGFFLAGDLVFFGVIALDSVLLTILPVLFLALGILFALWAPLGKEPAQPAAQQQAAWPQQ